MVVSDDRQALKPHTSKNSQKDKKDFFWLCQASFYCIKCVGSTLRLVVRCTQQRMNAYTVHVVPAWIMLLLEQVPSIIEWVPCIIEWLPSIIEWVPNIIEWMPSIIEWLSSIIDWVPTAYHYREGAQHNRVCLA